MFGEDVFDPAIEPLAVLGGQVERGDDDHRDGAAGIAMATSELPDLILMDLNLPEIDGWEATRRLKADPATGDIPIIALSAHAMAGDREKALATGCDDFDTKPIEFDRLLAKIEQTLTSKARGAGAES